MTEANMSVSTFESLVKEACKDLQRQAEKEKTIELHFNYHGSTYRELFRHIKFANLETLSLDTSKGYIRMPWDLEPFLQPKLKRLRFYSGLINDLFLAQLQESCPLLEELLIENGRSQCSSGDFIRFLDRARSLKSISIMNGTGPVITDTTFVTLATKPTLEVLEFDKLITVYLVSKAFEKQIENDAGGRLFPQLRKLICVAEPDGLRRLSPYLLQLTHLEANIKFGIYAETQDSIVHSIAMSCPNLHTFKLRYLGPGVGNIPSQALVNLAQGNSGLKELHIAGAEVDGFEEPHFVSMVRALPRLEFLSLEFHCCLTEAALIEVAKNCGATLAEFKIGAVINLRNATKTNVSFSELTSFTIGKFVRPTPATAVKVSNMAQFLKMLVPKVTDFNSTTYSAFTDQVIDEVMK